MLKVETIYLLWNSLAVAVLMMLFVYAETDGARDCVNGFQLPDGACDCYSCWTGDSCSQYGSASNCDQVFELSNSHRRKSTSSRRDTSFASRPPKFARSVDTAFLPPREGSNEGRSVYRAVATDPDEEFCKDPDGCSCSTVTYFIASQDEASNFRIDTRTGDVTLDGDSYSLFDEYQLTIGASDGGVDYDTMTLVVHSSDAWDMTTPNKYLVDVASNPLGDDPLLDYTSRNGDEVLSRHRRAVTLPANVTFTLTKLGANKNLTEIKVGVRIQFQLDIVFPKTTTDMQVELFAPDSDTIVMMLCSVTVTVGNNLVITGSKTPVMESLDNTKYNDRAVISLGSVTNSGTDDSSLVPSTITITYEAIMVENANTKDGQEYWVSAGAEYNSESDVWVGQASFTARTANDSVNFTEPPTINFTGPGSLAIGDCANYNLDVTIIRPVVDIKLDVYAPVNYTNVMSICNAKIVNVNDAYSCGFGSFSDYKPQLFPEGNAIGYKHVQMVLGRPINKLAREYSSASPNPGLKGIISFNMQVCLNDSPDFVSKSYTLGSSVQLGTSPISTVLLTVTAAAKVPSHLDPSTAPSFKMTFPWGSTVSKTQPVIVQLDMVVKEATSAEYELEIMVPVKDGRSILQLCTVKLVSAGENLACLAQRQFDSDYIISTNVTSSIYPDMVLVSLGTISNLAAAGSTQPSDASKNTVTFRIIVKATDHPDAVPGSVHDVYFGMFIGDDKLTVGKTNVSIVADNPPSGSTAQNPPVLSFSLGGNGNMKVPFGKTAQLLLDVTTFRNTTYSPFKIEFIMPNNSGKAMANICKVKVVSVGVNNPCFVPKAVERGVQMTSSSNDDIIDRAVIEMDSLCNMEQKNDPAEDHLVLALNVVLLQDPQFTTDPNAVISAGVYSTSDVKVLRTSLEADSNAATASLSTPPKLKIVDNNGGLTRIPYGYPARFLVRIKIAPNDSTPLLLNVSSTTDNALSLCALRVVRIGDGYPCVNPTIGILTNEDAQLRINKGSGLDLGYVTNVGKEPLIDNSNWDSNTIELEVVAKMTFDPAVASDGSTHTLSFTLNYDQQYGSQVSDTTIITTTSDKSLVNASLLTIPTEGQMNVSSITGSDAPLPNEKLDTIVRSESKRVVISVDTIFNSTSQLTISLTTPMGTPDIMEILYVGLLDAGENLPCLKYSQTKATYEPRQLGGAYNDIATLDLGYVCNVGVANDTTGVANRLRVEGIIRLLSSAKFIIGSTLQIHGTINSNNTDMLVFSVTFTIGDESTYDSVYLPTPNTLKQVSKVSLNSTENPIIVGISHFKTFSIVYQIPPFTSTKIKVDVSLPTNTSAIMTVKDVRFIRSGQNLPKLEKFQKDFVITQSSKHNTSQNTSYTADVGVISNSGVTYRFSQNTSDDDTFTVEFTLQMADNAEAKNNSVHNVSFGLDISSDILLLTVLVTASRTLTETVVFNVSSAVDLGNSTPSKVEIDTILCLSSLSTAEGQLSILNIFVPVYASYVSTVVTSPFKAITNVDRVDNAITLSFGPIFFTDEIHLKTTLTPNSSHPVPARVTGVDTVLSLQPIANTDIVTDIAGDLTYVNFTVSTTPQGTSGCAMAALGMESGAIKDCQISSSADSVNGSLATDGRYNKGQGWSPFVHQGKVKEERYFQVYFGKQILVTKIQIQQKGPAWATELGLKYSNDGRSWITSDNKLSMTVTSTDQDKDVPAPQASRYLRVMISDLDQENEKANFRFEFVGCETSSETVADPCTTVVKDPQRLPEFSRRTFMKAGSTLYVCDGIKGKKGIEQRCYTTTNDQTWSDVDRRVGSILGYNSFDSRLYAVSASADSYMGSLDGILWFSVTLQDLTKAKRMPTFKPAIIVPVDGNPKLNSATPDSAFTDSGYGATINGIMKNGATIFSWSDCCP